MKEDIVEIEVENPQQLPLAQYLKSVPTNDIYLLYSGDFFNGNTCDWTLYLCLYTANSIRMKINIDRHIKHLSESYSTSDIYVLQAEKIANYWNHSVKFYKLKYAVYFCDPKFAFIT